MRNLELTEQQLENIRLGFKQSGSAASIYNATDHSLYKIFKNHISEEVLDNKKKKIEMLNELQVPFFRNPIRTLSLNEKFIGYEIEYNKEDRMWWEFSLKTEDKIRLLQELKEKLCFLSKKGIIYGDLKDDNLLINSKTGNISFCDIDNVQIGNRKMDHILCELDYAYKHYDFYPEEVHIYMHNLFTANEFFGSFDNYNHLLHYLKCKKIIDSPFNDQGNKVIKQLSLGIKTNPIYLIDNLKKVS